ncbi:TetR/AcrR family transcriptional regulator [Salinarimonas ramus]|uniref:TetR family transcriptional regulator n=1 Tax=Salinarimonas ramus TaxID=690164 RepID=A0A917Q641_9HYPH|nr:TetR/AcrR family transcriptional regulator [Salinarimonas ramus]GGK29159.1 TetR family transcriptional regulator [Salinarimonas ramus]
MTKGTESTRTRILRAAQEIAQEVGPASVSLEAVAAKAGVSKGGLLYHFPSKAALLRGLVEHQLARFEAALAIEEAKSRHDGVIAAYLETFVAERLCKAPPSAGMLSALVEDPAILEPVRGRERGFLDAIRENAADPDRATIAYLALHGLAATRLLAIDVLEEDEVAAVLDRLRSEVGEGGGG